MSLNNIRNKGIFVNGFLIPYYVAKNQKTKGNVINKPIISGAQVDHLKGITNDIRRGKITTQQQLDKALEPYWDEVVKPLDFTGQFKGRFPVIETLKKDYKQDIADQKGRLAFSKANPTSFESGNKFNLFQKKVVASSNPLRRTQKSLAGSEAGAAAIGKAVGEFPRATPEELMEAAMDLEKVKGDLGSEAYKRLLKKLQGKYTDAQGKPKPDLTKDEVEGMKQLISAEEEQLNRPAAAAAAPPPPAADPQKVASQGAAAAAMKRAQKTKKRRKKPKPPTQKLPGGAEGFSPKTSYETETESTEEELDAPDNEYHAPDSKTASAPVAPVPSNLNTGAGSAAPPPPQPPPPAPPAPPIANLNLRVSQRLQQQQQPQQPPVNIPPPLPPPVPVNITPTTMTEGITPQERSENIALQISEQEKGDSGTKTDDNLDVSKYGYDKQVSIFAIQEDRDFTYSQTLVKASNPNVKEGLMEALKMWGYTIEITAPKTNDEAEALEIRTFIFLAKEKFAFARSWKRALTEVADMDFGGAVAPAVGGAAPAVGGQVGIITQFANPQPLASFAATGGGAPPPAPPPAPPLQRFSTPYGRQSRRSSPSPSRAPSEPGSPIQSPPPTPTGAGTPSFSDSQFSSGTGFASADSQEQEESKGGDRRRLTGFGREVGFTRDRIKRTERIPQGGQGVQRVRVAAPQQARPPVPTTRRLDTRPKMNVKEAQFKMRKSRINPNLLFTNLTKQNPPLVGTLPMFKTRKPKKR